MKNGLLASVGLLFIFFAFVSCVVIDTDVTEDIYPWKLEVVQVNVEGESDSWFGSGVFVADDLILTAGHVVEDADYISILWPDGTEVDANSWYMEDITDVGLIRIRTEKVEPEAKFSDVQVGEEVWLVGAPYGFFPCLTKGIVSMTGVKDEFFGKTNLVVVDAASNPGNSGGPLFDRKDRILGILVGVWRGAQGLGTAIPADVCEAVISKFKAIEYLESL